MATLTYPLSSDHRALGYERTVSHSYTRRDGNVRVRALWRIASEEWRARTDEADAAAYGAEHASYYSKLAETAALRRRLEALDSEGLEDRLARWAWPQGLLCARPYD